MHLFFQIQCLQLFCMDDPEFGPIWIMLFYVFFCNIIKVNNFSYRFIILLHLISTFSPNRYLLVPYTYVFIESIDCIPLSSFELNAIFLIFPIKTLCLSLLNLCCVYNNNLLFFYEFFMMFFLIIYTNFFSF